MKNLYFILILALLASCTDRTNFNDVGKATLKAVIKNDTNKLKELFVHNMDSLGKWGKAQIYSDILRYKDKNYSFIKADTTSWLSPLIDTYFKIDTNYYLLSSVYAKDEKGKISIGSIFLENLTKDCSNWITEPYCPKNMIKFNRLSWLTDYSRQYFKSGKVELENKTGTDLDYIKFRLILKNKDRKFFNQTVIYRGKIFAGDIIRIEIPGMVDLFTGFIINEDNFEFEPELIEVLPKPASWACKKIIELKTGVKVPESIERFIQ